MFNKYLLNIYCFPGNILGAGCITLNKINYLDDTRGEESKQINRHTLDCQVLIFSKCYRETNKPQGDRVIATVLNRLVWEGLEVNELRKHVVWWIPNVQGPWEGISLRNKKGANVSGLWATGMNGEWSVGEEAKVQPEESLNFMLWWKPWEHFKQGSIFFFPKDDPGFSLEHA